jgi:hypothetical protein
MNERLVRTLGCWFLAAQAIGATVWWCVLICWPDSREYFKAKGSPDSTLLAFAIADAVFFIGSAAIAAYGMRANRSWAWTFLCLHAGAAAYAALYCWTLVLLTAGDGLLGALLMSPSLFIPPFLVWSLRPESGA